MITRKTISGVAVAAGLLSFSVGAAAQDVLLKVSTTVGAGEPRAAEHKVTAGSEVAIYSDSLYRVLVKPTVVSDAGVQLSLESYRVHSVGLGTDARGEANRTCVST